MTDLLRASGTAAENGDDAGLFSVDTDAHLQKLASCMFPTPAQLPVELVRSALKRGAASVAVEIRRSRLVFVDDGAGIAADQWQELAFALDGGGSPAAREKAIASLQSAARPGIGLLAVLVPGVEAIRIDSAGMTGRMTLTFAAGAVRLEGSETASRGTRIVIRRRGGPAAAEKKLFAELCAAVDGEIKLNGRPIARKPVLRRSLVQQGVDIGPGKGAALVAIPAQGDICRIWLLDRQIPWQLFTSASCHGLVFDAAMESIAPATSDEFGHLAAAAGQLYQWLAEHFSSFPPRYQERIEELIYKKVRAAGDLRLLSAFAPFRLWRSHQRLSLEDVRRRAEKGNLYALPLDGDPGRSLGSHQEALLLTPRQRDFLLNHVGLPLVTPAAAGYGSRRLARLAAACRVLAARAASLLPRRRFQALDPGSLEAAESGLCREMEHYARELRHRPPLALLAVAMIAGRGAAPAAWRRVTGGGVLYLHRRHPLVRAAAQRVAGDRLNVELAFAALAPELFLTVAPR
jgi:hypothetical protein